ncbi:hypothetical protein BS333_04725 [Vibrio azureus]|uniref:Uncharacterized protein n=1 Tax=Vibrio azureus NBRC 104587 TaxID=1219077 RepID=U3ANH3_9VIBR|nr:hypothetical protein [Vibrio azureus]AUI85728.1 hypothetical protein BS333_04725 [Vibrio azureus]GAD74832.1 hypothetical protein VAZ01S_016_00160 [Vibrio azureus NBRC 104587]
MAFIIKETKLKVLPVSIVKEEEFYQPYPAKDAVLFDTETLIPIGLLSYRQFEENNNESIFIAVPNLQGIFDGDYAFITYSLTNQGWKLDNEYIKDTDYKIENNYIEYYLKSVSFYNQYKYVSHPSENSSKEILFELGGQPPLGQNWDAMLYDEMAENPELDHYHDVMEEGGEAEFEKMSTREITYFNEELEKEFIYIGMFSFDTYLDGGGECIVFYQPELKKVMIVPEFS